MYRQISEIQPAGIEPASLAWKASILPLNHGCFMGGRGSGLIRYLSIQIFIELFLYMVLGVRMMNVNIPNSWIMHIQYKFRFIFN